MRDAMASALARLGKHAAQFECEIDTIDAAEWDCIACEFDHVHDDQFASCSAGQRGDRVSHLLLRQHGKLIAGARLAIVTLPGFACGLAVLCFGPFWRRCGEAADLTMYRAALGAIVQEYALRRGHYLTIIPRPHPEFYGQETQALLEFGFGVSRATGAYDYSAQSSARIMGSAIYAIRGLQRTIRRWRYGV